MRGSRSAPTSTTSRTTARDSGPPATGEAVFPLVDAGLSKAAVRAVSRGLGLVTADKPAAACLSSRIAYGDPVSPEVLGRIERAEDALHEAGFPVCRVRAHAGGSVARIEVPEGDLGRLLDRREEIVGLVLAAGFVFVTADLAGLRSGSMNALLPLSVIHRAGEVGADRPDGARGEDAGRRPPA